MYMQRNTWWRESITSTKVFKTLRAFTMQWFYRKCLWPKTITPKYYILESNSVEYSNAKKINDQMPTTFSTFDKSSIAPKVFSTDVFRNYLLGIKLFGIETVYARYRMNQKRVNRQLTGTPSVRPTALHTALTMTGMPRLSPANTSWHHWPWRRRRGCPLQTHHGTTNRD